MKYLEKMTGVMLCIFIAWLGIFLSSWLGELFGFKKSPLSPIMLAILIGIVLRNIYFPNILGSGIQFSIKFILRWGIVFLGIRLSLGDILQLGVIGVPLVAFCIIIALFSTAFFAQRLGIPSKMGTLIAVGSSICGATAIVATAPMIQAEKEEITYAIANITIFGILAMLFYPYLAYFLLQGEEKIIGLFLGTSIHETAQVAGAGLIYSQLFGGETVLNVATVTKLIRNTSMAIVIPYLAYRYYRQKKETTKKLPLMQVFPLFIIGFIFFAAFRTLGDFTLAYQQKAIGIWSDSQWTILVKEIKYIAELCLTVAMAAIGLNTNIKQLQGLGIKPFYVGLLAAFSVGLASLLGIFIVQLFYSFH